MPTPSFKRGWMGHSQTNGVGIVRDRHRHGLTPAPKAHGAGSTHGADCRCRGTMLGPHCALLRQECSRFRGSGAMLSQERGHLFD